MMPRNKKQKLSAGRHGAKFWEEEKSNFGFKLMNKMGWEKGRGLGAKLQGTNQYIKAKYKQNTMGIGADRKGNDETWMAANAVYNSILKRLNDDKDKKDDSEGDDDDNEKKGQHYETTNARLEAYMAGRRLYSKFRKSKNLSAYSKKDMAGVFGEPPPAAQEAAKKRKATIDTSRMENALLKASGSSIADYFGKKMAAKGKEGATQFNAAGGLGFTEKAQTDYFTRMTDMSNTGRIGLGFGAAPAPQQATSSFSVVLAQDPPNKMKQEKKKKKKKKKTSEMTLEEAHRLRVKREKKRRKEEEEEEEASETKEEEVPKKKKKKKSKK